MRFTVRRRLRMDPLSLRRLYNTPAILRAARKFSIEPKSVLFVTTLLLAREQVAWDATATALSGENLLRARRMVEAFDSGAETCERAA